MTLRGVAVAAAEPAAVAVAKSLPEAVTAETTKDSADNYFQEGECCQEVLYSFAYPMTFCPSLWTTILAMGTSHRETVYPLQK